MFLGGGVKFYLCNTAKHLFNQNTMTLTEKIRNLCLAGITAAAMSGCYDYQYHFKGRIGRDYVVFWEESLGLRHYLKVNRHDGTVVTYIDIDADMSPERVIIESPRGIKKVYRFRDVWTKPIFAEAEKQYQSYLKKIIEAKTKEGTNLLVGTESR